MRALCFGSLNIDFTYQVRHFVRKGETLSSDGLQVFPGGKGLNQSIALARAGAQVWHAGAVGEDGRFLLEVLASAGVHTELVDICSDVRTGNAIIQNDSEGDNCILLYGGANQAISEDQIDRVLSRFSAGDFLILQNEINNLPVILERAHKIGMQIVLNPSPMDEKILALPLETVDWFLLNEVEAGQLLHTDGEADGVELAKRLIRQFPHAKIVLTLGQDGAVYADGQTILTQAAFPVKAVDTTAAGDTFTGFFLSGMMEGQPVETALRMAAKAAAIAVTRHGAAPSIPTREEVIV